MIYVAVLGHGVVGSGVVEVLCKNAASIAHKAGDSIEIRRILDLREFPDNPLADRFTKNFQDILEDGEIRIVVETMGGLHPAYDFVKSCLEAGKSVVTSNKELVAAKGDELLEIARRNNLNFLFEASVGGGIPILRPLDQCLAANEVYEIAGILNGTTNFMLTQMVENDMSFDDALSLAQRLGYAERDPSADIDGDDACRKICILASLAFGRHIYPRQVPTEGITGVTLADVGYADACGRKIKLLGRAIRRDDGRVCAYVAPHLVDGENPLAGVEDVFNAITVKGDAIGDVMFYGRGAGKLPTASAVVADVMDAAKHLNTRKYLDWGPGGEDVTVSPDGLESGWYVRARVDAEEARRRFPEAAFLARPGATADETAFLTGSMTRAALEGKLSGVEILSAFRMLEE